MNDDMSSRLQKVFTAVFGRTVAFNPSLSRKDEPRWTSLKHVEFIIAIEKEFSIRFDGADATDMISMPVVFERIQQRLR